MYAIAIEQSVKLAARLLLELENYIDALLA
jgi:hypothetical protein